MSRCQVLVSFEDFKEKETAKQIKQYEQVPHSNVLIESVNWEESWKAGDDGDFGNAKIGLARWYWTFNAAAYRPCRRNHGEAWSAQPCSTTNRAKIWTTW